ncbi:MAG: NAD(P)H-binding protein [Marmoricola sp.]
MQITLIGGHGRVALLTAPLLVAAGHQVVSVIRNPDHSADVAATGATPRVADVEALDGSQLRDLLAGSDLVVWSAGAGGGDPRRTRSVDRDAAIASVDAAKAAGVPRYVMVSYFGAGPDHGVPSDNAFHAYAEAKAAADAHLRGSALAWTILGPSSLTDEPGTGTIEVGGTGSQVSRADVAAVIAAVAERPALAGRTIEFNNGPTPVAGALDALAG